MYKNGKIKSEVRLMIKGNILLVDDEIKITEVVKAYLDKEGYNTFVALMLFYHQLVFLFQILPHFLFS